MPTQRIYLKDLRPPAGEPLQGVVSLRLSRRLMQRLVADATRRRKSTSELLREMVAERYGDEGARDE
jgi:hypothetical protein